MRPVDALVRYLWEQGLDVYTDPWEPPGHLVVRDGDYARVLSPGEVELLAATLLALGVMDERGRPLRREGFGREARRCVKKEVGTWASSWPSGKS